MKQCDERNWELASAYIDNELSPEERTEFEASLLQDPHLAEILDEVQYVSMTMKRLRSKKEKVASAFPRSGMRKYLIGGALAASLTAAVVYSASTPHPYAPNPAYLHHEFASQEAVFQPEASLQQANYPADQFPDLSAGNFTLIKEKKTKYGIAAHYIGRRSCRLTLIIGRNIPQADDPEIEIIGWTANDYEYMLMSEGMDPARFQLLGDYLRKTTADRSSVSQLALRRKIRKTKSCT